MNSTMKLVSMLLLIAAITSVGYAGAGNRAGTGGAAELLIPSGTRDIAMKAGYGDRQSDSQAGAQERRAQARCTADLAVASLTLRHALTPVMPMRQQSGNHPGTG